MATSQKKTGGSRSAASRGKGSGSRGSSSRSRAQAPAHKPFRRELGAVICLLLAIFSALGYFHMEAIFIDLFCGLIKGLLGYGFWLTPPALLLMAYILAFHRGRPVRLRLVCAGLLPVLFSCFLHSLLAETLPWDLDLWTALVESGRPCARAAACAACWPRAASPCSPGSARASSSPWWR